MDRLVIATNENDILARTLDTGAYEVAGVMPTTSPSMDIQVSSNFERLLFDACGRDAALVRQLMNSLKQGGRFEVPPGPLAMIRDEFDAYRTGETGTRKEIERVHKECGVLIDPHTAVGVHAARKALAKAPQVPMVVLGTAHPAKFPDAVTAAVGAPAPLPPHLAQLMAAREHFSVLPNDQAAVERFVRERARAATA
jgi:threonine synthase